jgi:TP901 family phage tail tape measure protein
MPLRIPATVTGLQASIEAQAKKAGKNLKINLGTSAKSIEGLSQPLGRITGKADQFTKSMEAANARVLAFGASVGVLSAVTQGFKELVNTTIQVEKQMASINTILGQTTTQLEAFKRTIFDVARNTEQSFDTVAGAALELSRQGLKTEQVVARLNDALVLSRLSGLGATEAVAGLTAAINSFNKDGVTSSEVLNKLSAASIKAAVSERDLIEGIKRSGAVAIQAGVSLDELVGVISAVQEKTARGGAVIGNSFKTIFTRIQSLDKLKTMQQLGVQVEDASGAVLSGTKLIQNLADTIQKLPDAQKLQIAENLVGKFQIAPFLAILDDYNSKTSTAIEITDVAAKATNEAYQRNVALNKTLSTAINEATINLKELADTLGKIGITESLQNVLGFFNSLVTNVKEILGGEGIGSDFAKGIVKGIGGVLAGPGLAIFGAIVAKLTVDLVRFGVGSLKTFFGLNKAAQQQATLQGQIASTLLGNKGIQQQILSIENSTLSTEQKRAAQIKFFTTALNEQLRIMTQMQGIAGRIAPAVLRGTAGARGGRAAGGYIPNFNAVRGYGSEQQDIARGVGGAPPSARPVAIPNFNFGGGQRGSVVANTSEFIVPNFAGTGGSAIFNQDMVSSMGLPSGAKPIGAAGGFIPNFQSRRQRAGRLRQFNRQGKNFVLITARRGGDKLNRQIFVDDKTPGKKGGETYSLAQTKTSTGAINVPTFQIPPRGASGGRAGSLDIDSVANVLSRYSTGKAIQNAKLLSGRADMPRPIQREFIRKQLNPGSVKGMAGTIFEASLAALLSDQKFKDVQAMTHTSLIDLPKSPKIYNIFGVPQGMGSVGAEVKGTGSTSLIKDAARKFYDYEEKKVPAFTFLKGTIQGQSIGRAGSAILARAGIKHSATSNTLFSQLSPNQRRVLEAQGARAGSSGNTLAFSRGYIPNFANGGGPLQDAIQRESAAGLPINQIRVNQDPRLRNQENPMGLAVTNTRDEPTGAIPFAGGYIPNFVLPSGGAASVAGLGRTGGSPAPPSGPTPPGGQRDLLGPIFAVTAAMSALSGATSGAESTMGKVTNELTKMVTILTTFAFAATAMRGFAKDMGDSRSLLTRGFGKVLGSLSLWGSVVGGGIAAVKGIGAAMDAASGEQVITTTSLARLSDAAKGAARNLANLSAVERTAASEAGKRDLELFLRLGNINPKTPPEFVERAKSFRENITRSELQDIKRDARVGRDVSGVFELEKRGGVEVKGIRKSLEELFTDARARGFDFEKVITVLAEEARGAAGGTVGRSLGQRGTGVKDVLTRSEVDKAILRLLPEFELFDEKIKTELEDFRNLLRASGFGAESLDNFLKNLQAGSGSFLPEEALKNIRRVAGPEFANVGENLTLLEKQKIIKEEIKRIEQEIAATADEGRREELKLTKELLKGALDKRQVELTTTKDFDRRIKLAQSLGTLNKDELRNLRTQKLEFELNNKLLKRRFELVKQAIDSVEGLSANEQQRIDLQDELSKLTAKQLTDADAIAAVIQKVLGFDNKRNINAEEIAKNMVKIVEAGDGSVLAANAFELATKKAADNTDRIRDNLDAARTLLDLQIGKDAFDQVFQSNEDIADLERLKRDAQRTLDQGGLNPEQREGLQRQIRGLNFGIETSRAGEREARLLERARSFDLGPTFNTRGQQLRGEELRTAGFKEQDIADIQKGARLDLKKRIAEAKTTEEAFKIIETALKGLGDTETSQLKKRLEALKQETELSRQSTEATLAQSKAELELIGIRIKTANDLQESSRQLEKVGFGGAGLAAARRAAAVAGGPADVEPSIIQDVSDKRRSVLQRLRERPEFDAINNADTLATTIENAAINFKNTMSDALVDAIARGESLGDALRAAATDFFSLLAKGFMQSAVDQITGVGLGKGGGGGFNLLSLLFGGEKKNRGGIITGGSGTRDDVPTLLTGGEFVIRRASVNRYGRAFLEDLNEGNVPQMQAGGFYSPGTFGQGSITGSRDLLRFATQSSTSGQFDRVGGGEGLGFASLEPMSARLTMFGRRNSPLFQREQESQREAFGLFARQSQLEEQLREQREQQRRALLGSVISAVVAAGVSGLVNQVGGESGGGESGGVESAGLSPDSGAGIMMGGGASGVLSNSSGEGGGFFARAGRAIGNFFNMGQASAIENLDNVTSENIQEINQAAARVGNTVGTGFTGGVRASRFRFRPGPPSFAETATAGAAGVLPPLGTQRNVVTPQTEAQRQAWLRSNLAAGINLDTHATGGYISPAAGVDTVPSMLSGGEFVMNAAATQRIGRGNLSNLNGGGSLEGGTEAIVSRLDQLIDVSGEGGETVINITVNSDGTQTTEGGGDEEQQTLALRIRDVVRQTIEEEKRLGGSLRRQ